MKLSVNILTLNGEFLDRAVEAVKPYAHEVIVRDTADIQHLGTPWTNSPLDARLTELLNEMKEESTGDWILKVDDDEIFPQNLMEEIMEIKDTYPIYAIPFLHISPRFNLDRKRAVVKRLFKNLPQIKWEGIYGMETLTFNGQRIPSKSCPQLSRPFIHLGELRKPDNRKHDYHTL